MVDPAKWPPLPSVEEILAGETQGGVPRPSVSIDDLPRFAPPVRPSLWARLRGLFRKVL